jgi:hypothetical protein
MILCAFNNLVSPQGNMKSAVKLDCKTVHGINSLCKVGFRTPFNNPYNNISTWEFNQTAHEEIVRVGYAQ